MFESKPVFFVCAYEGKLALRSSSRFSQSSAEAKWTAYYSTTPVSSQGLETGSLAAPRPGSSARRDERVEAGEACVRRV